MNVISKHQATAPATEPGSKYCDAPPSRTSPFSRPLPLPPSLLDPAVVPAPQTLTKRPRKGTYKGRSASLTDEALPPARVRVRPAEKRGNPPRPANAWICYRSARVQELKSSSSRYSKLPQADISKIVGQLWRSEPPEVRRQYEQMAEQNKKEHSEKYPGYVFRPARRNVVKRTPKPRVQTPPPSPPRQPTSVPSVFRKPSSLLEPLASDASSSTTGVGVRSCGDSTPSEPELPVPPPLFDLSYQALPMPEATWSIYRHPISTEYQLPTSPAWGEYDCPPTSFSLNCLAPSQLDLPMPIFSPTLQHANTFLESAYLTPPPSATEALFADYWSAAASRDFIEIPTSYAT
ncbi:hypothetical protein JCM11641_005039 [Rhodosporidiobolus odoratus]